MQKIKDLAGKAVDILFTVMNDHLVTGQIKQLKDYSYYSGESISGEAPFLPYDEQTQQIDLAYDQFNVTGLLLDYSRKDVFEACGRLEKQDKKFILRGSDFNRDVCTGNEIIINAVDWTVVHAKKDPTETLWTLQIRPV